jgi:hypothetical protein
MLRQRPRNGNDEWQEYARAKCHARAHRNKMQLFQGGAGFSQASSQFGVRANAFNRDVLQCSLVYIGHLAANQLLPLGLKAPLRPE